MADMTDEEFEAFTGLLDEASRSLGEASLLADEIEGFAPGSEVAFVSARAAIDAIREIEAAHRHREASLAQ
ncbi:MAG: hypothetical protein C5B48_14890 [Candidatus Rokuibacteriota bacterium]|nr:MAG: hypothetical protein C5B48_14890 [Candidatus Rokubacteria bacterium]